MGSAVVTFSVVPIVEGGVLAVEGWTVMKGNGLSEAFQGYKGHWASTPYGAPGLWCSSFTAPFFLSNCLHLFGSAAALGFAAPKYYGVTLQWCFPGCDIPSMCTP